MGSVHVAAFWDLGWNTPIMEVDLWRFLLRDFGVDQLFMSPISGISKGSVIEFASIEEILEANSDRQVVFCDERSTQSLTDFDHPENVLYIFGKANFSPFLTHKREQDLSLRIDTKLTAGLMWGHQAAAIILYDRIQKWR